MLNSLELNSSVLMNNNAFDLYAALWPIQQYILEFNIMTRRSNMMNITYWNGRRRILKSLEDKGNYIYKAKIETKQLKTYFILFILYGVLPLGYKCYVLFYLKRTRITWFVRVLELTDEPDDTNFGTSYFMWKTLFK